MHAKSLSYHFGIALVIAISLGLVVTAQSTRFEFLAAAGTIVIGSGDTGDVVVITGRNLGWRQTGTCGPLSTDSFPLQMGVALDPGDGGRGPRTTEIQPLLSEPLRPGTRLKNLALVADCQIGGVPYQKFTGEIE